MKRRAMWPPSRQSPSMPARHRQAWHRSACGKTEREIIPPSSCTRAPRCAMIKEAGIMRIPDWLIPRWSTERGSLLLWALGVNALLLLAVIGYFPFFQTTVHVTAQLYLREQALALAEAGVQETLSRFNDKNNPINFGSAEWIASSGTPACTALGGTTCYTSSTPTPLTAGDGSGDTIGTFEVIVANPLTSNPRIQATGRVDGGGSSANWQQVTVQLDKTAGQGVTPNHALFKPNGLQVGRDGANWQYPVVVDSYNSCVAPYDPLFPGTNGYIGSNSGQVKIWPQSTVKGNLEATTSVSFVNQGILIGSRVNGSANPVPPPITIPSEFSTIPSQGNLYLTSGMQYTCTADTDERFDAVYVSSGAELILEEGCRLYVSGTDALNSAGIPDPNDGRTLHSKGTITAQGNNRIFVEEFAALYGTVATSSQKPEDLGVLVDRKRTRLNSSH